MADLMKALTDAHSAAQKAVTAIRARMRTAGPGQLADLNDKLDAAVALRTEANERLIKAVLNPGAGTIARLETATAKLEKRIAKFKAQEESLGRLAEALDLLAGVVKLVPLV